MTEFNTLKPADPVVESRLEAELAAVQYSDSAEQAIDQECADFQAQMPARIGAGEDLQTQPHMLTCERCRALVRDLEYIAEAAKQLMPIEEEPREDLWEKIQSAIKNSAQMTDQAAEEGYA